MNHFVRIGLFGSVGSFTSSDATVYPQGSRVVCRTTRGSEVGQVLSRDERTNHFEGDGTILRAITIEDDLLLARLEKNRNAAYEACVELLRERQIDAVLMDVEHLFDGASLFFYFLGEVSPELEELTSELAAAYETQVEFRKFAETVTAGCGPDCGTEDAENGCQSGACATCSVSSACGVKNVRNGP